MEAQEAFYKNDPSLSPAPLSPAGAPVSGLPADSPPPASAQESVGNELHEGKVEKVRQALQAAEGEAKQLLAEAEEQSGVKMALEDAATFGEFWLKFLNDWTFHFAAGLAYNLLMAMFPIVVAAGAITGFVEGGLHPAAQAHLIAFMSSAFPSVLGQDVLAPALLLLRKDAGFLGILAIITALYSGSRLFSSLEDSFAIIYHTPLRSFWRQNLLALLLLLIFLLLIPVMLLADSVGLRGFLSGLVASLILFQAIYMIVPNQKISLKKSWRGTLVAAAALQLYLVLFPVYIRHFLGSYTGNTGFAVILLLFFFYFALILLIGAEVNAFYAEGVRAKPQNLAELVHEATLATDKAELLALARQRLMKGK
jgi:membrane protein